MKAKLQQNQQETRLPAGLLSGTEAFWHDGQKWIIHNGVTTQFESAPIKVRNIVLAAFLKDMRSRSILRKHGYISLSGAFEKWYRCVVGAIDGTSDFNGYKVIPDAYNDTCNDFNCPLRGLLCSTGAGLKNYEVETIKVLKGGLTFERTADLLCLSLPGLKSRIEKIKLKLGANNMASLIARASYLGI